MRTSERIRTVLSWIANRDVKRFILAAIVSTVVVLVIIPLVFLVWTSLWSGSPGQVDASFTLENFQAVYLGDSIAVWDVFVTSAQVAGVMTVTGMGLGFMFAWLFVRTNLPTKGPLELALLSGMAIPGYIYAYMYLTAYNRTNGVFSSLFQKWTGAELPLAVTEPWGAGFIVGITVVPTAYLLLVPALQDLDPALEEASRVNGASMRQTLRAITLPLIKPAILAGVIIIFLYGLGEFSVVAILAPRGGFDVYSTMIYEVIRARIPPDYGDAAALACSLVAVMFVLVMYYRSVTRRKEAYMTLAGQGGRTQTWDLGRWRWPIAVLLWSLLVIVWLLPVAVLVLLSLHTNWTGSIDLSSLTLSHYSTAMTDPQIRTAFVNSLLVAIGGGTLGTVLVVGLTYYTERTEGRFRGLVDFLSLTPMAVPGIIMGSSLLVMFLWVSNVLPAVSLYGTLWIIIIGCVVVFIPVASRIAIGNIVQIHSNLEEAARSAGASWLQEMRSIFLPLFQNTVIIIWFFLAINIFQLLSIPVMTYTSDTIVIPVKLFQMYTYNPQIELFAAISTIFVVLTALLVVGLRYAGVRFYELRT